MKVNGGLLQWAITFMLIGPPARLPNSSIAMPVSPANSVFLFSTARLLLCLACLGFAPQLVFAAEPVDFSRDIRPLLSNKCFQCHGPDESSREADLRLDVKASVFTVSEEGAAVVPGRPEESALIMRVASDDEDIVMPPADSNLSLTSEEISLLKRWVSEGAKWSEHWSFVAPVKPQLPTLKQAATDQANWPRNAIDAFVLARLEKHKLHPSPPATKEQLIRRVTLDLTGLPPTLQEVDAFLEDASPTAYEKLVDRLLSSPSYGERWCWDWLDAARYADSSGYQGDPERTMWPWRDWVIDALNADMPYDQFTIEQLAGDLLPQATHEQILATGFNRNHMQNGEGGRIAEETRVENVFDRLETTGAVWLGLTLNCCRCHDHKFDPVLQREYYQMYDFFNQTSENGGGRGGQISPVVETPTAAEQARIAATKKRAATLAANLEAFETKKFATAESGPTAAESGPTASSKNSELPESLKKSIREIKPQRRDKKALEEAAAFFQEKDDAYVKLLQQLLAANSARASAARSVTKVMVMDQLAKPRESFILTKGAYDKHGEKVPAGVPASLPPLAVKSGANRLHFAQWLMTPEHPLTARVTVNRFWQSFFGVGLVKTAEDFGSQGEAPSHPLLLDWLAVEFHQSGWDVKALHKLIVCSATYRQSSKVGAALLQQDPNNRLLARGPRHRLPSWMIRDQALALSGLQPNQIGGAPMRPYQPPGIWEEATFGKKKYVQDHGAKLYRRTIYIFWRRIVGPTMIFDNAARQTCTVKAVRTNTPLHALATLNDITYVEAARVMAEHLLQSPADPTQRLENAFRSVTARRPTPVELKILLHRLKTLKQHYLAHPEAVKELLAVGESSRDEQLDPVEHAAWTGICSLLLNLDETISKQ